MRNIQIIGIGMGNPDTLTAGAVKKIREADLLVGAERMLALFRREGKKEKRAVSAADVINAIEGSDACNIAVLMSGDTGYFSGTRKLMRALDGMKDRYTYSIVPGISCIQYFASVTGNMWDDMKSVSVHGRNEDPVGHVLENRKTFFLLGNNMPAEEVCRRLAASGLGHLPVTAGERLSYEDEKISRGTAEEFSEKIFDPLSVLLVENPHMCVNEKTTCGIKDSEFIRGGIPMTKEEVRTVSLSKLALRRNSVIWDVGAGTGSVSVEAALAAPAGQVYAVECAEEGVSLIEKNRDRFHLQNLHIISGTAPEALSDLPDPDCVFIGGSRGSMKEILEEIARRSRSAEIVVNAVTVETFSEAVSLFTEMDIKDMEIVQVQVARSRKAGRYNLMEGMNPVFIISGTAEKNKEEGDDLNG